MLRMGGPRDIDRGRGLAFGDGRQRAGCHRPGQRSLHGRAHLRAQGLRCRGGVRAGGGDHDGRS